MEKFTNLNHPFHSTGISPNVKLPQNHNDVLFFHNFKIPEQYIQIRNVYGNRVIDQEEIVISYKDNTLFFEKNSFLTTKKFSDEINFVITNLKTNQSTYLHNQKIFNYWLFYISNLSLERGLYKTEIYESGTNRKIFNNIIEIK